MTKRVHAQVLALEIDGDEVHQRHVDQDACPPTDPYKLISNDQAGSCAGACSGNRRR